MEERIACFTLAPCLIPNACLDPGVDRCGQINSLRTTEAGDGDGGQQAEKMQHNFRAAIPGSTGFSAKHPSSSARSSRSDTCIKHNEKGSKLEFENEKSVLGRGIHKVSLQNVANMQ